MGSLHERFKITIFVAIVGLISDRLIVTELLLVRVRFCCEEIARCHHKGCFGDVTYIAVSSALPNRNKIAIDSLISSFKIAHNLLMSLKISAINNNR